MTILGLDISHWSSLAHTPHDIVVEGYDFLFWKATQGSTYFDKSYPGYVPNGYGHPRFAAFHYMDESDANLQVSNIIRAVPREVPVILDVEQGNLHTAQEILHALRNEGYISPVFYLPEWYWVTLGRPDLSTFPPLWASVRVPGNGLGSLLYQKVSINNWHAYGNNHPALLQFTQHAVIPHVESPLDVSAFNGDLAALDYLLTTKHEPVELPAAMPYTVRPGDTLWEIAFITLGDSNKWQTIATANGLSNPNRLFPGQALKIPGWDGVSFHSITHAISYTVRAGDSLTTIAHEFGVSVQALYDANRLTIGRNPNIIHPGLVLNIPRI